MFNIFKKDKYPPIKSVTIDGLMIHAFPPESISQRDYTRNKIMLNGAAIRGISPAISYPNLFIYLESIAKETNQIYLTLEGLGKIHYCQKIMFFGKVVGYNIYKFEKISYKDLKYTIETISAKGTTISTPPVFIEKNENDILSNLVIEGAIEKYKSVIEAPMIKLSQHPDYFKISKGEI